MGLTARCSYFFIPFSSKNAIVDKVLDGPNLVNLNEDTDQTGLPNLIRIHAKILEPPLAKIDII